MAFHNEVGRKGEDYAAALMKKKGYHIEHTNWKMGHLEMDVICSNQREIVFVEVKTRTSTFGNILPEQYVDAVKRARLIAAGNAYLKYFNETRQPRFDIIGIVMDKETGEIIETHHLENAILPHVRSVNSSSFNGQWHWGHRRKVIGRR